MRPKTLHHPTPRSAGRMNAGHAARRVNAYAHGCNAPGSTRPVSTKMSREVGPMPFAPMSGPKFDGP